MRSSKADNLAGWDSQTIGLACSDSVGPDWQLWKAALHALAAMPEAQACPLSQRRKMISVLVLLAPA